MRILLIDDEPGVLRALQLLLKAIGHDAVAFSHPEEALTHLRGDQEFSLILCDLRMAPLNGFEVLQVVTSQYPGLPFVLISAHATEQDVAHAKSLGAVGFLAKPFQPHEFNSLIAALDLKNLAGNHSS